MKTNSRSIKVNDEIKKELSEIIRTEIKDPRLDILVTVMRVETSTDFKLCRAYVSVFGNSEQKSEVMAGLKSASGFIRKEIARRINLRITPEISFFLDETVEEAARMNQLIAKANENIKDDI